MFPLQIPVAATVLIWTFISGHLASLAPLVCFVSGVGKLERILLVMRRDVNITNL